MSQIDKLKKLDQGLSYEDAAHGVQTAIAFEIGQGSTSTAPKHLRTGIDLSKADMLGLVSLLIDKGILTEVEYLEALRLGVNAELVRYEDHLSNTYGISTKCR